MRAALDALYRLSEALACTALAAIAALVVVQVLARALDQGLRAMGAAPLGFIIPSLAEFGAFLLVAATGFALGPALRAGTHVRVSLLTDRLAPVVRRVLAGLVALVGLGLVAYVAWYALDLARDAWAFDERSYGLVAIPLWVPQGALAFGFGVLALALADEAVAVARGEVRVDRAEAERAADPAAGPASGRAVAPSLIKGE